MKYFNYKDENLTSENVSIADIATEVQTPVSYTHLRAHET